MGPGRAPGTFSFWICFPGEQQAPFLMQQQCHAAAGSGEEHLRAPSCISRFVFGWSQDVAEVSQAPCGLRQQPRGWGNQTAEPKLGAGTHFPSVLTSLGSVLKERGDAHV